MRWQTYYRDSGFKMTYDRTRERFSLQCRKLMCFALIYTTLRDWLKKKLAPLFHPIRSEAETNHDASALVFPRFASATCIRILIGSLDFLCPVIG